jgi:predicted lipoprotein with Yx(FWY)xxD motif
MKTLTLLAAAIAVTTVYSGAALATSHGNALVHNRKFNGQFYTMNQSHMTLYFFDGDEKGISNCYDDCAATWPPAVLDADAKLGKSYGLIPRTDGTMQITFKGRPLYTYANDTSVGDLSGDGVGGVWHLSRP